MLAKQIKKGFIRVEGRWVHHLLTSEACNITIIAWINVLTLVEKLTRQRGSKKSAESYDQETQKISAPCQNIQRYSFVPRLVNQIIPCMATLVN